MSPYIYAAVAAAVNLIRSAAEHNAKYNAQANAFAPNWGQVIFQSANEINQNILIKQRTAEIQSQVESEKAWWERRRADIRSEFMQELDGEAAGSDAKAAAQQTNKKAGSDDDVVLVDAEGLPQSQGAAKKKKAKK